MRTIKTAVVLCDMISSPEDRFPMMSEERKEKTLRLFRMEDRRLSVGAELAVYAAYHMNGDPFPCPLYSRDSSQRPISGQEGRYISISHSGTAAICAVSDIPVGADVEFPRKISRHIEHLLTCSHAENSHPDNAGLLQMWTACESYFKLTGEGISPRLLASVCADSGRIIRNGSAAAYYDTLQLNCPECIITCCASVPVHIEVSVFTPEEIAGFISQ